MLKVIADAQDGRPRPGCLSDACMAAGDSEAIVSTGHSSGGAVSAMLGASGDSPAFDKYLEEIGAYDESDTVFIAHASAPITNLSSADASYEWFQKSNPTYLQTNIIQLVYQLMNLLQ